MKLNLAFSSNRTYQESSARGSNRGRTAPLLSATCEAHAGSSDRRRALRAAGCEEPRAVRRDPEVASDSVCGKLWSRSEW